MDGWYSMEDLMLYSKIIANKRYNNPSSPLNAIAGWGGVMRGSNKWCKMSHRDVNARRILSYAVSGVVHNPPVWKGAAASCSASPPPGARLAPDRRASGCSVLWKTDSQTASLLSPQFFFFFFFLSWLLAFGCPLSIRRQAGKCHGWEWAMVFSASRGETEEEEVQRRRRWSGGDGDGGGVRGGFGGSKHDGVSCPPTHAPPHPSSSLSFFSPPPYPYHTHKRQRRRRRRRPPRSLFCFYLRADFTPPPLHPPPAAARLSSRDNWGEE